MLLHAVAPKDNIPALHWAAKKGHLGLVQYLLTIFPVDLSDDSSDTALHAASQSCRALVTEHLLLHGADVNRINHNGASPLDCASGGLSTDADTATATVQILLAHGADVQGKAAAIPLRYAIDSYSPTMARLLLDAGASPDTKNEFGEPVIVSASSVAGAVFVLQVLLDYGADINATTDDDVTALMTAAELGLLETVQLLVVSGANLNLVDSYGYSVFAYAAMSDYSHVLAYLVGREGFDINAEGLVHLAVSYGCDEALKVLLQRGAPANQADHMGLTPLMLAIDSENLLTVKTLLDYWTHRSGGGPHVFQALMFACVRESKSIVGLLLENGVDINMVDGEGLTVMAHAKIAGRHTVVQLIASYGGV